MNSHIIPPRFDFLLSLDDAIRPLIDAAEITGTAAAHLGKYLRANRCAYADVEADEDTFNLTGDYNDGVSSIVGRYTFAGFGAECLRLMRAGDPYIVDDSELDPRTSEVRSAYRATSIRAVVCVPLLKAQRFVAAMAVHQATPRRWKPDEIELLQLVASRCWESIERARVQRELRDANDRLQAAILAGDVATWVWHVEQDLIVGDQNIAKLFGVSEDVQLSIDEFLEIVHPDDVAALRDSLQPMQRSEAAQFRMGYRVISADGLTRFVDARARIERSSDGQMTKLIGVLVDVTAQKLIEKNLREAEQQLQQLNTLLAQEVEAGTVELGRSEQQFAQLVQGVVDCAIYRLDVDGKVASWNVGAARIKGYSADEIVGEHFSKFYSESDRARNAPAVALATAAQHGKFEGEGWRLRKDGTKFWASVLIDRIVDEHGSISGYAKITRDMTERRQLQEQLNHAQKMEAIGQLTGGVAHDFNNLLTVILGNLDSIFRRAPAGDERLRRAAEHAMRGAERAAALTHQLLAFSRRQPLSPKPVNVHALVTGFLELVRRTMPETIAVKSQLTSATGVVRVDPNQLESALLNLAVNARDAMQGKGELTVATQTLAIDESVARSIGDISAGTYIVISVSDTGVGMSPEVMGRAFEPFYTTKPLGEGTGLGLSQVFGFVKQSGGHVQLRSEVGQGTSVLIYLPRVEGHVALTYEAPRAACDARGFAHETILVVEDEPDVRAYSMESLQDVGFSVLGAPDAAAALLLISEHPEISLLFTDVGLPGMNGAELAQQMQQTRPDLPVLFTTAYAHAAFFQPGRRETDVEMLRKPFSSVQLVERVRGILDQPR